MFTKEEIKQGKCRRYHLRERFRYPAKEGTNLLGKLGQEIKGMIEKGITTRKKRRFV